MVDIATGSVIDALAEERRLIGAAHLSSDGACAYVPDRVDEIDNLMNLAVIDTGSGGPGESSALELRAAPSQLAVGVVSVAVPYPLTVRKTGPGRGTVTGLAGGISCGATGSAAVDFGRALVLTAQPAAASAFVGWTGCDSVAGRTCRVAMIGPRAVVAHFARVPMATLSVEKATRGDGSVTGRPAGVEGGPRCPGRYPVGTRITLTATPAPGSLLGGGRGCPWPSGSTFAVTARTTRRAGLSCGAVCSQKYAPGTVVIVTLTANATPGAVFVESGGCPLASGTTCSLGVTRPTTVFAVFTQP